VKKIKLLSIVLAICCVMLSGCVGNISEMTINPDGSGSCTLLSGYEKEIYDDIHPEGSETDDGRVLFTYNGIEYIGDFTQFDFENTDELNETLTVYSTNVETGEMKFNTAGNGKLTFSITTTEKTGDTSELEDPSGGMDAAELEEMLASAVVVCEIKFPAAVKKVSGAETKAITVSENNLKIDFIKLGEETQGKVETYVYESSEIAGYTPAVKETSFKDVLKSDWFYNQVTDMAERGLFKGKGDNYFCPNHTMTKAEFITVATRIYYDKATINLQPGKPDDVWWYKYYILGVYDFFTEEEIPYNSMGDGIKRQEMALIAGRLVEKMEGYEEIDYDKVGESIPDFSKVKEENRDCVAYCYAKGILTGDDKGNFNPDNVLTRAEASTVIYRIINPDARIVK